MNNKAGLTHPLCKLFNRMVHKEMLLDVKILALIMLALEMSLSLFMYTRIPPKMFRLIS